MTAQPSTTLPTDRSAKPYRVIYALVFRFAPLPDDPPDSITEQVVALARDGNSDNWAMVEPRDRTKRIIDLRAGDDLLAAGKWRTITAVSAFRDSWLTAEWVAQRQGDGYLYRPAAK